MELYEQIFRRKSIRKHSESLTAEELKMIEERIEELVPLVPDIKVHYEIVERKKTSAKFGEYCLLFYSEKKDHYLLNAGYLLEQMDLFLASKNIGTCWYGLAQPKEKKKEGLNYIIMLVFGKSGEEDFRKDLSMFRRKENKDIWEGHFDEEVIATVRLAPSACNSQPWQIKYEDNLIKVYRNPKTKTIIPSRFLHYYNKIDMGIFLYFLDLALRKKNKIFKRELVSGVSKKGLIEIANYHL